MYHKVAPNLLSCHLLPQLLTSLYNKKLFDVASFSELSNECEKVIASITISAEHSKAVEQATRSQSKWKLWYMYRAGRITASNFKTAVHTISNPSQSFIKQICYPQNYKFKTQATQWGIHHERLAIASFSEQIISNRANLHIYTLLWLNSQSSVPSSWSIYRWYYWV